MRRVRRADRPAGLTLSRGLLRALFERFTYCPFPAELPSTFLTIFLIGTHLVTPTKLVLRGRYVMR